MVVYVICHMSQCPIYLPVFVVVQCRLTCVLSEHIVYLKLALQPMPFAFRENNLESSLS